MPHLAIGSPTHIAMAGLANKCVRSAASSLATVLLWTKPLACADRMAASWMFSVQDAAFNTRDLSAYECGTFFEILRTFLRLHFELPMVCDQADIVRSRDHDEFCSGLARSNATRMHLSKASSSTGFCK